MKKPSPDYSDLNLLKKETAIQHKLSKIPSNSLIIRSLRPEEKKKLLPLLKRKTTRTISGVTVIAVMTKPYACPQDAPCAYCPGGPALGVPQSYTGFEPAAMRGLQNEFNPFLQVETRIGQLKAIGHEVDKIELIIMGGTFPASPLDYQEWFVKRCLDAITGVNSENLEEAKKNAEHGAIRNVGITVETRPDWGKEVHVDHMLGMGVTRVEMGVQNPDDTIYRLVGRKHTVRDVVQSTRIMKDSGLKTVYHMMPGLPGSDRKKDLQAFKKIFTDPRFKPDMVKIYPCLVLKKTRAYEWYREKTYHPYTSEAAADLVAEIKKNVPRWIRIMRVQRDIPANMIIAGVKKSNLRQLVQTVMEKKGYKCNCIRCREVGHRTGINTRIDEDSIEMLVTRYEASDGLETFISAEETKNDILIGYARLRLPSEKAHRKEVKTKACSIVRELHIYGSLVPIGKHSNEAWQHKGFGSRLMAKAESITRKEYGLKKILVISALGTKQYYRKLGYRPDGVYMSKTLEDQI